MPTPLDNLPLNTQKVYVRGILPGGCELYIPVNTREDTKLQKAKSDLQAYLDTFPEPDPLVA